MSFCKYHFMVGLWLLTAGFFSHALTYDEAIALVEAQAPQLTAGQRAVQANQDLQISSGRLPDPQLTVGIDNLPIEGEDRYATTADFMTMKKIGVMQEIPNADKRRAQQAMAKAETTQAQYSLQVETLLAKTQTAQAWLTLYYLQQQKSILHKQTTLNQQLINELNQAIATGRINYRTSLFEAQQQESELKDQLDLLQLEYGKAQALLQQIIGDHSRSLIRGRPPQFTVHEHQLLQAVQRHPHLAQWQAQEEKAKAQLQAAVADKKSDWSVGTTYQQRADRFGDMMSLEVKMGLPFFTATRQGPAISAKQAQLSEVTYQREAAYRSHIAELTTDIATYKTLQRQLQRLEQERLPIATAKVSEQQSRLRLAQIEPPEFNAAQQQVEQLQLQKVELQQQRDLIAARLHFLGQ